MYLLAKTLNSREDYRIQYLFPQNELVVFDKINPCHYVFYTDTETCTPVYTEYQEDYNKFYANCSADVDAAKLTRGYKLDEKNHPNYFDASYISWLNYDSLHIELPDGYLYYMPIINWGRYEETNGKLLMPLTVRLNHAVADGYLVSKVFLILSEFINEFVDSNH